MSALAVMGTLAGQAMETGLNFFNRGRMEHREDTAIQRRVADMKAGGINPILAAGQPASSQQGHQASIDTNLAQDMLVSRELKKLNAETNGINSANQVTQQQLQNLTQEYNERLRNIKFYERLGIPSDRPNSWVTDLEQMIQLAKDPNKNSYLGQSIDYLKNLVGNHLPGLPSYDQIKEKAESVKQNVTETGKKAVDSYVWFLQHTPLGMAVKGTKNAWDSFQKWRKETFGGKK